MKKFRKQKRYFKKTLKLRFSKRCGFNAVLHALIKKNKLQYACMG